MSRKTNKTPASGDATRKRRTHEHVIADRSVHHVEGFVLKCGYSVQRVSPDYSYDLWLRTFNDQGEVEDILIWLQLKAANSLERYQLKGEDCFSFPASIKDYRSWTEAVLPVYLILYDDRFVEAYWLDVQEYAAAVQETKGQYLRLRISRHHVLGVETIRMMRLRKNTRAEYLARPGGHMNNNNESLCYGQLYRKLKELGFQQHTVEIFGKKAQVFAHEGLAGSMIVLPDRDPTALVETPYIHQVLITLKSCGLLPETNPLLT